MYDSGLYLNQGQDPYQGMQFSDALGSWLNNPKNIGGKGRVKFDPEGNKIPVRERLKPSQIRRNPYGITAGNAIDPNVTFAQAVLSKANKGFQGGSGDIYNGGGAY